MKFESAQLGSVSQITLTFLTSCKGISRSRDARVDKYPSITVHEQPTFKLISETYATHHKQVIRNPR